MLERIRTIVVPVDFSNASVCALRAAASLAEKHSAAIHVLHVYQDVFSVLSMRTFDLNEEVVEKTMLDEIKDHMDALLNIAGIEITPVQAVRKGGAAECILRYSKNVHADLIVIATNARSGLENLFIGSVTQRIVRSAHCPVLTCRATDFP